MNIKEAKDQIKKAIAAYTTRDEFGDYLMPTRQQRPIFLMGPPGIGKTAIMEQIAQELDLSIVTYSMTHHTRQSALGLPFIREKTYGGETYRVSEYTMSEILASVYDIIEETGKKEGILFLDEINCVSETLAPSMLQFLQYKVFGQHQVPEGWTVVTAGNPAEFNNSVHDFDIVTWDRLKRIDVEPDYGVWKEFALSEGVHPSIITYLDIKKDDFFEIENTVDGRTFVTARGWVDLSKMIDLFEQNGFPVDEQLVVQYLQNRRIAKDFAVYYDLFQKYRKDYKINDILEGKAGEDVKARAKEASFDERVALLGLLLDALNGGYGDVTDLEKELRVLMESVKARGEALKAEACGAPSAQIDKMVEEIRHDIREGQRAGSMSKQDARARKEAIALLERCGKEAVTTESDKSVMDVVAKAFEEEKAKLAAKVKETMEGTDNVFRFCDEAFGSGNEALILTTELTASGDGARFIARYGSEEYYKHNKDLLYFDRQKEIMQELSDLDLA